jgi:hypothetical protein
VSAALADILGTAVARAPQPPEIVPAVHDASFAGDWQGLALRDDRAQKGRK